MKILSWRSSSKDKSVPNQAHDWTIYVNPRNRKVRLNACARCGVLKGLASDENYCVNITKRVTDMFDTKGWTEDQIAS